MTTLHNAIRRALVEIRAEQSKTDGTTDLQPLPKQLFRLCLNSCESSLSAALYYEDIKNGYAPHKKKRIIPRFECSALSERGARAYER